MTHRTANLIRLAVLVAFAGMLGSFPPVPPSSVAADPPAITATLKENQGVGVGIRELSEQAQSLTINLSAPSDWSIDESEPRDNDGDKLWLPEAPQKWTPENPRMKITENSPTHTYMVTGLLPNHGHAVGFFGRLTKAGPAGGTPPTFDAAVADIDLDVDVLGPHTEPNWPPTGSDDEDAAESDGPSAGLVLPPSLVSGDFPATASGTGYKILELTVRPKWAGPPQSPTRVGTVRFFISDTGLPAIDDEGIAIYEPDGGARLATTFDSERGAWATSPIDVGPQGFEKRRYGMLTNEQFDEACFVTAEFTWDEGYSGGSDSTTKDQVRLAPNGLRILYVSPASQVELDSTLTVTYKNELSASPYKVTLEIRNKYGTLVYSDDTLNTSSGTYTTTWDTKWNQVPVGGSIGAYANPLNGPYTLKLIGADSSGNTLYESNEETIATLLVIEVDLSDPRPSAEEISSGLFPDMLAGASPERVAVGLVSLASGLQTYATAVAQISNAVFADLDNDPSEYEVESARLRQEMQSTISDGYYKVILKRLRDLAGNPGADGQSTSGDTTVMEDWTIQLF